MTADDRSLRLRHQIRAEIRAAGGAIPFARFMDLALYAPNLGYYETDSRRVGRGGDFYTSVSTGPLFGELLAWQCLEWIASRPDARSRTRRWTLLECGAHDGSLARDILTALDSAATADPQLVQQIDYVLLEPSPSRRAWQESTLTPWAGRVRWINAWPAGGIHGVILSNELLDAFPVHRIGWSASAGDWFEWGVAGNGEAESFSWVRIPRAASTLVHADWPDIPAELAAVLPDGFTTEVGPAAAAWWTRAANALQDGWMVTLDYGLDRIEFLQPQRAAGTLRAYRNHTLYGDLLADPGDQDLTAQVDFTAIATAGEAAGLETMERTSQRRWLTEVLQRRTKQPGSEAWLTPERIRQFQTLTHPQHLGRGFSVLVQRREKTN